MKIGTALAIVSALAMSAAAAEAKRDKREARQKVQAPLAMSAHAPAPA